MAANPFVLALTPLLLTPYAPLQDAGGSDVFAGRYFRGRGDVEYLQLLDIARRMFAPDPEFQNLPMLYTPAWNGLVEGPTWNMWWIQNSYGTTYAALPFYEEPYVTFLQNSQDLWFDQMGDGKRAGMNNWVAPDGCLCDAAAPGQIYYKQGDGRIDIHDWGMEFTAAGLLMQAELLLISRDAQAIPRYLPRLERCANFLETRRDPRNNLFLAGPAATLLAPGDGGYLRPDGTRGPAYLAGLSITYIAALDRLIELEKLAGDTQKAKLYAERRDAAKQGLPQLTTPEGYFIKWLDPDGTKHGVYGAAKHGYFETPPNHDAIALRVVDDAQAARIYAKLASIPELRPHDFIIPNYPALDDMYTEPSGIWTFGTWVNGGHWSTCEGRMVLAYCRLGRYDDARRSMQQLLTFARRFRMDNPLTGFGSDVYQPGQPINLCYDTFAPAAALVRGLFEYVYRADGLTLIPHIPPGITELDQRFPIRFGTRRLYLSTSGSGPVTAVTLNDREWKAFDAHSVRFSHEDLPPVAQVHIVLGDSSAARTRRPPAPPPQPTTLPAAEAPQATTLPAQGAPPPELEQRAVRLRRLHAQLVEAGLGATYEAAHVRLALECIATVTRRQKLLADGKLTPLPEPARTAADQQYLDTALRLCDGWDTVVKSYAASDDARRKRVYQLWEQAAR
jgi:hypothetical protein